MRHPPPAPTAAAASLGALSFLLAEPRADRRRLHFGLALAAATHVALFAVTWPQLSGPPAAPEPSRVLHVIPLSPPIELPQHPIELPPPPARRVPVPAIHPDAPEILSPPQPVVAMPFDELVLPLPAEVPPPPPVEDTPSVVEVGREITAPRLVHKVEPVYPEVARQLHIHGAVLLELTIDQAGEVADVVVVRGLRYGLTAAAVAAARQWRFEPSTYQGRPVSVIYRLTVRFTLH